MLKASGADKALDETMSNHLEEALEDTKAEPVVQTEEYEHTAAQKALVRKQDIRIVPLCAFIYLLCFLDRSNIGNAKSLNANHKHDLLSETHMTDYQYTIALMLFLVAYGVFEVPSNYYLKKFTPSKWIAFLMLSWGALTMGLGGAKNYATVAAIRFLLGTFEAGLFPGFVYYITFWYRADERSLRVAYILASATVAGAFGGALAFAIGHMDYVSGLAAWRWLFILEGLPSCLSAFLIFFFLPDYPESATWLNEEEKAMAIERLRIQGSHGDDPPFTWEMVKSTLLEWRLYAHYLVYFCLNCPYSSLSLFTPSITAGLGYKNLEAQLMTVPPYAVAYVFTLAVAYSADRFNARALHCAGAALIGAIGFLVSGLLPAHSYSARYGCLIVATCGSFGLIPPLLGWLSSNLHSTASAGLVIGINQMWGAPGQITGVWIYKADQAAIGYPLGHFVNSAMLFTISVVSLALVFPSKTSKIMSVVDWHDSPFDVYIGRFVPDGPPGIGPESCPFGNPFVLNDPSDPKERAEVIANYERWLLAPEQAELVEKAKRELKGKVLGCWCKPRDCHGDILRAVTEETAEETEKRRAEVLGRRR
ncbi:hypothetical protein B7463_g4001, partial [Scytalidium lignicola]